MHSDGEVPAPDDGAGSWITRAACALRHAGQKVTDLAVPPACSACHALLEAHHTLCGACWRDIAFIRAPLCDVTGIPLPFSTGERMVSAGALANPPAYDRARAAALHAGAMRRLVHQFKYQDRLDVRPLLGRWLQEAGRELLADADVLVPVPMGRWRLLVRRYNQAAVLAAELTRLSGVPTAALALRRRKVTKRQVGLSAAQRRSNVAGAFHVPETQRPAIAGKRVVLVDDVITTGATVQACARALRQGGAQRVDVLALALVVDPADMSG